MKNVAVFVLGAAAGAAMQFGELAVLYAWFETRKQARTFDNFLNEANQAAAPLVADAESLLDQMRREQARWQTGFIGGNDE